MIIRRIYVKEAVKHNKSFISIDRSYASQGMNNIDNHTISYVPECDSYLVDNKILIPSSNVSWVEIEEPKAPKKPDTKKSEEPKA